MASRPDSAAALDRQIAAQHALLAKLHLQRAVVLDTVSHDERVGAAVLVARGLAKNAKQVAARCCAGRVSGAIKVGHAWTCTISAWIASGETPRKGRWVEPVTDDDAQADQYLAQAGLRSTRRTG